MSQIMHKPFHVPFPDMKSVLSLLLVFLHALYEYFIFLESLYLL